MQKVSRVYIIFSIGVFNVIIFVMVVRSCLLVYIVSYNM